MLKLANRIISPLGFEVIKKSSVRNADLEPEFLRIYKICSPFTMTSLERMYSVFKTVEYLEKNQIAGDIVECGVWKGGSSMMAIMSLIHFGNTSRNAFLYDTFEGMSSPTEKDISIRGEKVNDNWEKLGRQEERVFCYSTLDEVKQNIMQTGYPGEKIKFIQGKVEETIPSTLPGNIALLRLDTDWYESTRHEMQYLYPLLVGSGVLIIDDYGHWAGARQAIDEYFITKNEFHFLHRLDYTGRIMIRPR